MGVPRFGGLLCLKLVFTPLEFSCDGDDLSLGCCDIVRFGVSDILLNVHGEVVCLITHICCIRSAAGRRQPSATDTGQSSVFNESRLDRVDLVRVEVADLLGDRIVELVFIAKLQVTIPDDEDVSKMLWREVHQIAEDRSVAEFLFGAAGLDDNMAARGFVNSGDVRDRAFNIRLE